jgi:hypothetical protein
VPANRKPTMIELSRYAFETLREDEEFALCRGRKDQGEPATILSIAPVSEHPAPATLERLEHQYSLRDELDSDWAARPFTLVRREGRTMLLLQDPGGEPLDRLLGRPMELTRLRHPGSSLPEPRASASGAERSGPTPVAGRFERCAGPQRPAYG